MSRQCSIEISVLFPRTDQVVHIVDTQNVRCALRCKHFRHAWNLKEKDPEPSPASFCMLAGSNTLPKTNIDPDNGPIKDYFPLPTVLHGLVRSWAIREQFVTQEAQHFNA